MKTNESNKTDNKPIKLPVLVSVENVEFSNSNNLSFSKLINHMIDEVRLGNIPMDHFIKVVKTQ